MKIVHVTPGYPPTIGGVETHVEAVCTRLADRGHDVTVLSADAGTNSQQETRHGVTVQRFWSLAPNGAFHFSPGIVRAVRSLRPDVVHAHNYHSLVVLAAAIGHRDCRFVITPHYHGGSQSNFRDRLLRLYQPIGRKLLQRADTIVAVSDWEQTQLAVDFGIECEVIPNGIDVERFSSDSQSTQQNKYLLCVGRLEEYKGVQYAIRALTLLPEYELRIAGSGPYRAELEKISKTEGVGDRVEFLGYVPDDELPALYANATVFLSLSSFEAFGLTVGEALASGTPCIVHRRGALVDWEQCDGVVGTDALSPGSVSNAIEQVRGQKVDPKSVPKWSEHVDRLLACYSR